MTATDEAEAPVVVEVLIERLDHTPGIWTETYADHQRLCFHTRELYDVWAARALALVGIHVFKQLIKLEQPDGGVVVAYRVARARRARRR